MSQDTAAFPIVFVGHVDHGKSSLIGRLLHETDSLPTGKVDELQSASERRKVEFEWSFVLDSLQLERDQAITVDSTQIWFHTEARRYVIVDAPGHHEFLRNMVTGASAADAAILVVDAKNGVCEQTRRHAYLLHLIGVSQIIVAINKMDLVGNEQSRFEEVKAETEAYLGGLGESALVTIPLSAKTGLNMTERSADTPWYTGPTLLEALDGRLSRALSSEGTLRLPVQDVYRRGDKRIIVGRVENGSVKVGDELTFWPTGRTATLTSVEGWSSPDSSEIGTGQSVGITLDHEIFVERGHVAVAPQSAPRLGNMLSVRLFWLSPDSLKAGENLTLKLATSRYDVTVDAVDAIIDIADQTRQAYGEVKQNGIAEVTLRTRGQIVYDLFRDTPALGRGVLLKGHNVVGGCIIEGGDEVEVASQNLTAVPQSVDQQERFSRNGYRGGVLWMTGLSGAGKSTLAMALQRNLFEQGIQVYTLDGDNVRAGLNRDLGFSEADRTENLRRIAEVAKLFADSGTVVIAAFIAPTNAARAEAREICGDLFHEVYVKASLETCEGRDVKGLYAKARRGEIDDFTGISAPWEEPEQPDVVIQTDAQSPTESLSQLQAYVSDHLLGRGSKAI